MRGRPRKHAAMHLLDGTYRPREHDTGADTRPAIGECEPTRELSETGKEFFDTVIRAYPPGTLGESDAESLTQCSEWVERIAAIRMMEREAGVPMPKLITDATKNYLQFAVRFGLTPADRGKVKLTAPTEQESKARKFFGVTG